MLSFLSHTQLFVIPYCYYSIGVRDHHLELQSHTFGGQKGTLHFIKFATSRMSGFMDMVTENELGHFSKMVCATGGGAFKFENDFKQVSKSLVLHLYFYMSNIGLFSSCVSVIVNMIM